MDQVLDETNTRNIGGFYACFMIAAIILIVLGLIWFLVAILLIWLKNAQATWNGGAMWWLFFLPPFAWIFFCLAWACLVKRIEDGNTKKRQIAVYGALRQINMTFLKGTDVKTRMGSYSSWLEVMYNPQTCKFFSSIFLFF